MKKNILILITALFFFTIQVQELTAGNPADLESDTLRVGLVLSGGAAKGIAHVGILRKLEEAGVKIDVITGTSMGALVGGLYSIGYTTEQLEEIGYTNNWEELFTDRPSRKFISNYEKEFDDRTIATFPIRETGLDLPTGIVGGQNLYNFLSNLTWPVHQVDDFTKFPIPFSATVTELETGKAVHLDSGYLPDAIRASISIPSLITPYIIDGVPFVDGGISNNLPVDKAIEMGANYIIAVNVASPLMPVDSLRSLSDILNQTLNYRINEKIDEQKKYADIYITPDGIDDFDPLQFDRVTDLIEIGKRAGDAYFDQFLKVAEMQNRQAETPAGIKIFEPLKMNNLIIRGNSRVPDQFIVNKLQIPDGTLLTPDYLDDKIDELFSTQLFNLVTYRLVSSEDDSYDLIVNVAENRTDFFRVGMRFDTDTQASILLSASFRNLLHNGSTTQFDLRLGDETRFLADHLIFGRLGSRLGFRTQLLLRSDNVDIFVDDLRVARYQNNLYRAEMSVGNYLGSKSLFAAGIRQNFIQMRNTINEDLIPYSTRSHHSLFGLFRIDGKNRKAFPNRGQKIIIKSAFSDEFIFSPINYLSAFAIWDSHIEIANNVSINHVLYGGYSTGQRMPFDAWFSPNSYRQGVGLIRFGGFNKFELTSRNLQMGSFGARFEPVYHRFIGVDFYAGRFTNDWNILETQLEDIDYGVSLTFGALTIIGPLKAILSSSTQNTFLGELQIGFNF